MRTICKKIFWCAAGVMMIGSSLAQNPRYAFNLLGGYTFANNARFDHKPRQLAGTATGGLSLEVFTGPATATEILYQLDISSPIYRHFSIPVRDKKEGIRVAYIMINEVFYVPIKEKWQGYVALGPGLGLVCIDDAEVLESIAWNVRTGVKKQISSWLSWKVQLQLFSATHQGDAGATPGNAARGINLTLYQFGVTGGLSLKL